MSYIQSILEPGEQVRYHTTISWTVYTPAILLAICALLSVAVAGSHAHMEGLGWLAAIVFAVAAVVVSQGIGAPFGTWRPAGLVGKGRPRGARRRLGHRRFGVIERIGADGVGIAPAGGMIGKRCDPGLHVRIGTGDGRPRRQLISAGHGAHDIGFDDNVGRTADHQQMFDVVASDQHEPPSSVDRGGIDDSQTRHPPALGVGAEPVGGESADQPGHDADQRQNRHKREEECKCLHTLSPANRVLRASMVRGAAQAAS